ncbi:MAG: hypothetical protein N2449_01915 [Bacteroidales bacterium]|nr:hypothetical protein [Bacteroidales bacterium]
MLAIIISTLIMPYYPTYNLKNVEIIATGKTAIHKYRVQVIKTISNTELERIYKAYGLVNIQTLDTTIWVNLKYAQTDNFLKRNLYGEIKAAYVHKDVAIKLVKASSLLRSINHNYRLVVLDAARPLSIQKQMWVDVNLPNGEREKFVANPELGSLHNYGAAVDVTIATTDSNYLDMGTPYDTFSELAYTVNEDVLVKKGKLTEEQVNNRRLLRKVMTSAGFSPIETEWWHFNACSRKYAKANYALIVSHIYEENPLLATTKTSESMEMLKEPKSNVFFKVQILTSSKKYTGKEAHFKGLKVQMYVHNQLYKYTVGNYRTLEQALEALDKIKQKGFADAFVVAFNNNERIGIKDAIELLHSE